VGASRLRWKRFVEEASFEPVILLFKLYLILMLLIVDQVSLPCSRQLSSSHNWGLYSHSIGSPFSHRLHSAVNHSMPEIFISHRL